MTRPEAERRVIVSDAAVEVAAKAALAEFCQPSISVTWSELQPAAKNKWLRIGRAALRAVADALPADDGPTPGQKIIDGLRSAKLSVEITNTVLAVLPAEIVTRELQNKIIVAISSLVPSPPDNGGRR